VRHDGDSSAPYWGIIDHGAKASGPMQRGTA
jgi:hypothetical protein